jgi:hypothetical protein
VLRIPNKDNRKELDQKHLEICEKVDTLESEINSLKNIIGSWDGLQKSLALLRGSRVRGETNTPLENQIEDLEERLAATKQPHICEKEIDEKLKIINQLRKDFISLPFFLPAEHFETVKQYRSIKTGKVIRHNTDPKNKAWYLYESSEYASPQTKILFNDRNEPVEIVKYVRSSETYGQLVVLHIPILLDVPLPPKKPNKPYKLNLPKNWKCPRCTAEVNENLQVCFKCGFPRPVEKTDKDSKDKGLLSKLKRKKSNANSTKE